MSLLDYFGIIDNGLKQVFDRKAIDSVKARRPLLRGIDRALAQFKAGSTGTPTGLWRMRNGVIALTIKVGGKTVNVHGAATNYLPADRFEEFLASMRAAVDSGEFDAELAETVHADAEVTVPKRTPATILPEAAKLRGTKAAATRKANREKKGSANS